MSKVCSSGTLRKAFDAIVSIDGEKLKCVSEEHKANEKDPMVVRELHFDKSTDSS